MAKGNDGNLLQHTCELAAMRALLQVTKASRFHLYCTHAMAPSEPCEPSASQAGRAQFVRAMNIAAAKARALPSGTVLRTAPLIDALAGLRASESSYPNTAAILSHAAAGLGATLSGVLVDARPELEAPLRAAFPLPHYRVACSDWRAMARYRAPDCPWLYTMNPHTFSPKLSAPDVTAADLKMVGDHVNRVLVPSGQPGVVTVFCYSMGPETREAFWNAAVEAFGNHPLQFVAVRGRNVNLKHIGAVMSTSDEVQTAAMAEVRAGLETVEEI